MEQPHPPNPADRKPELTARVMRRRAQVWMHLLVGIALLVFFNIEFNVYGQNWRFGGRLPVELTFCALLVLLALILPAVSRPLRAAAAAILALGALVYAIDVASRAIYGRAIDLVFDAAQIPHVLDLLASSMGWALVAPLVAAVLLTMVAILFAFARSVRSMEAGGAAAARRIRPGVLAALTAALFGAQIADLNGVIAKKAFASSAPALKAASYHAKIISLWLDDGATVVSDYRRMRGVIRDGETTLPRLRDVNVYLIFVESYGASLLERAEHRAVIEGIYNDYAPVFEAAGTGQVSTLLDSPTYGGLSWLAHLTTTAGAWIDTNLEYRAYLRSDLDTLATILKRTGHRTALFMPGIKRYWPEGDLLRFDDLHTADDLDYRGVSFGYFGIPDQFTLERIPALQPQRGPRFVKVAMISSHYPFRPLPPFLEDRTQILDPSTWAGAAAEAGSFTVQDWADPADGYIAGARYALRSAFDFAARHTEPEDLVIIMGDHQPWSIVSGNLGGRAAPIHVLSGRTDLLECFRADGYRDGLSPKRGEVLFGMDWVMQRLVAHFGDRGPVEGCAPPLASS